jgi:hypothetical protein
MDALRDSGCDRQEADLIDDDAMIWFALRERRGSMLTKAKLPSSAARRQTFAAAMAQFEEQMTAAKVVSPATRSLNLYYGLAQAGMAIAAVHAPDPWSFSRHGLTLGDTSLELADIQVGPDGDGAFQRVATATASPVITAPVDLGALWASLPDLRQVKLHDSDRPRAYDLMPHEHPVAGMRATLYIPARELDLGPDLPAKIGQILTGYPGTQDVGIPVEPDAIAPPPTDNGQWSVLLQWPPKQMYRDSTEEEIKAFFDGLAPEYRYHGDRYLRPSVEGGGKLPPSPLMTWWLLLYSFSMLTRYQPRKWTAMLNVDAAGPAVALQFALEMALSALPHLVLEALDGERSLLSQPLRL